MRSYPLILLLIVQVSLVLHAQHSDTLMPRPGLHLARQAQTYIPYAIVGAGLLMNSNGPESVKKEILEERNEHLAGFRTHVDDYLQYAPIGIAYGLDAAGIQSRTDVLNRTLILLKGELIMTGVVTLVKTTTRQLRPDGSGHNSFPSGHTAQAFAAATFLSQEYKHRFRWMPYVAYGLASSVGALRMANNKHYISDVLVGAGIGILSMKIADRTHRYRWGKKQQTPRFGF